MTKLWKLTGALLLASLAVPAFAEERPCGLQYMVGEWVFMTDVGRQALVPAEGDITAIGTMNIGSDGSLEGVFDVTFEDFMFIPDVTYDGSVTVDAYCTGTVEFVTSTGSIRTDSIVIVNRDEFRGMSQDINNLWTYTARRIQRDAGDDTLDAKINAIMRRLALNPIPFEEAADNPE